MTANPLYIGTGGPGWLPLSGVIDEVKMFNRALKPNQIKRLMKEASVVQAKKKLTCYWGQLKVENMRGPASASRGNQSSQLSADQSAQGAHGHGLSVSRKDDRQNRYHGKNEGIKVSDITIKKCKLHKRGLEGLEKEGEK